ncbi:MAG: hypothetical protein GC171_16935 [Terrimonas sp.]|nr:hypothetical protein [Terrimonas sp.]
MKKTGVIFISLLLFVSLFGQKKGINLNAVDRNAIRTDALSPRALSLALTAHYHTDLEKVRAIFRWITEHIEYRIPGKKIGASESSPDFSLLSDNDTLKDLDLRVAERVMEKRSGYCDGYARLFKTLCSYAGIPAEIIVGYARSNMVANETFRSNHSWNAVYFDSSWHLLDVTWASGYLSLSNRQFVKRLDETWFLTAPADFIRDHYPDNPRWTLLTNPPVIREFIRSPFRSRSFVKYPVLDFFPRKGILEAAIGDTLKFVLETAPLAKDRKIAPDFFEDTITGDYDQHRAYLQPVLSEDGQKAYYQYPVQSGDVEWLNILFNEDILLRYRLVIRNRKEQVSVKR